MLVVHGSDADAAAAVPGEKKHENLRRSLVQISNYLSMPVRGKACGQHSGN
jgi:hypothetical protein